MKKFLQDAGALLVIVIAVGAVGIPRRRRKSQVQGMMESERQDRRYGRA